MILSFEFFELREIIFLSSINDLRLWNKEENSSLKGRFSLYGISLSFLFFWNIFNNISI